jgi:homoserine kinase
MRVRVRVPATTSNLGPGFDAFGMALDLCNEFTVDTDAEPGVAWEGEGADELPTDGSDMVSSTMRDIADSMEMPLPPLALTALNRVPLARGLGSSSSAAVAGVVLASRVLDLGIDGHNVEPAQRDAYSVFAAAERIEGHPDNAAPAVYGGITVVVDQLPHRIAPHPDLVPVVVVPDVQLSTETARDALPVEVPLADAVFNIAHGALLVQALTTDPSLLPGALRDRLHQEVRLALVPEVHDVFDELWRRRVPVCVSGAGPALLAFALPGTPAVEDIVTDLQPSWRVWRPGIRADGFDVTDG